MSARLGAVVGLCMVAALAVSIGTAGAAPPPGGGGGNGGGGGGGGSAPTGTIYYVDDDDPQANRTWSIDEDGRNPTLIGVFGVYMNPSHARHANARWFLTVLSLKDEFYPDTETPRREVCVVKEDGTKVQLTDDPETEPLSGFFLGMQWSDSDRRISYAARTRVGDTIVDGGLYTAELAYGADGSIVGLAAPPTRVVAFPLGSAGTPRILSHSWDPSGTKAAYNDPEAPGLWIVDVATGSKTQISTLPARYPDWAPAGGKIVFSAVTSAGGSVYTINEDGTSLTEILKPTTIRGAYWRIFDHPSFSRTGNEIVLLGWTSTFDNNDVFRMTSTGGSLTNLTDSKSLDEAPIRWVGP